MTVFLRVSLEKIQKMILEYETEIEFEIKTELERKSFMEYVLSEKYHTPELLSKIMGPNPLKLAEELLTGHKSLKMRGFVTWEAGKV